MTFGYFITRLKNLLTLKVVVGRKGIWVAVESVLLDNVLIEVIIETLNFLFICSFIESIGVAVSVDLVDYVSFLFH